MGFSIVQSYSGVPNTIWAPIVDSDTIFNGSIVDCQGAEGVAPIGAASGAADTSGKRVPFGVVVGNNLYNQAYNSTQQANSITEVTPHDSTVDYRMKEGTWPKGDREAMVQVALITAETVLRAPLYNGAVGTVPTVLTVVTGDTNGVSCTTNATDVAGIAVRSTLYFRSGANAGAYRITDDTSTTALTWDKATTDDVEIGDTAIRLNLRALGPCQVQFDAESTYVDIGATATSDYYAIDVIKLDLSTPGSEHVYFKFNADHFGLLRA